MPVNERQAHPQTTSDRSQQVDLELFTFIERYATNLARWDVLLYFGQHPAQPRDVDAIATCVGRFRQSVQKELDDLVYLGVLRTRPNGKRKLYELTRTPRLRRAVLRLARHSRTVPSER